MKTLAIALLGCLLIASVHNAPAACTNAPSSVVSWWAGDGNAFDLQDSNFGLTQNGATFAPGKVDFAFSLDGTNDFVTIPHNTNLNPAGPFSVDAWVKANPVQLSPQFLIVDKSHGFTDGTGWALQGNTDGTVGFLFGKGGGTGDPANFPNVSTVSNVLDNQWHHLAGVFTGARLEIYFDGKLQNITAVTNTPVNNTRDAAIGRSWGGGAPTRYFRGLIDEVQFFSRALSSNEVAAIFDAGGDGQCKSDDLDGDGLPNAWEIQYGLDPLSAAGNNGATGDPDVDGMNNLQEFRAGTHPLNSASVFRITAIARESNNVRITWMTGVGKTNFVQRASQVTNGFAAIFTDIFGVSNTLGPITNYLDPGAATGAPARFYRIRLGP